MEKHNIMINFVQRTDNMLYHFTVTGNMISMQNQKILRPYIQTPTFMIKYHCCTHSQVRHNETFLTNAQKQIKGNIPDKLLLLRRIFEIPSHAFC